MKTSVVVFIMAAMAAMAVGTADAQQPRESTPERGLAEEQHDAPQAAPSQDDDVALGIRFEGLLPGSIDPRLEGEFDVEFRIYHSPQGGEPIWRERQSVRVEQGRMDVLLGTVEPVPMAIHEATFKFLGAAVNGQREVYPRYAIVNVVYASSQEISGAVARDRPADGQAGDSSSEERVLGQTESSRTWREALIACRNAGRDLPSHDEWYRALVNCSSEAAAERAGHYEWVLPWVYDTASHGEYNRYFRGRLQGCDYMDLSPGNGYVFRMVDRSGNDRSSQ